MIQYVPGFFFLLSVSLAGCPPDAAYINDTTKHLVLLFKTVNEAWMFDTSSPAQLAANILAGQPASKVSLNEVATGLSDVPNIAAAEMVKDGDDGALFVVTGKYSFAPNSLDTL